MNRAVEYLQNLSEAMKQMKQVLMKRKPDDILECARTIEKMVQPFRDSMLSISGSSEDEKASARRLVEDIRKTCRNNSAIASTFCTLLDKTLSKLAENPAKTAIYGKGADRYAPASPLLVYQEG